MIVREPMEEMNILGHPKPPQLGPLGAPWHPNLERPLPWSAGGLGDTKSPNTVLRSGQCNCPNLFDLASGCIEQIEHHMPRVQRRHVP